MRVIFVGTVLGMLAACGGASSGARVTSPFTDEHAQMFDDGIDFVADPTELGGSWSDEWQREIDLRVSASDFIAVVHIDAISTDNDPEQRVTYRLMCNIESPIFGSVPEDTIQLSSHESSRGFASIRSNETRMLDENFLAYVKWYRTEAGDVRGHFHMTPATENILDMVRDRATRRGGEAEDGTRVVVHEN